jgi:nitroreductase
MDVIHAIKERREITSFNNSPIPDKILEEIVESGYLAPTGNNLPSREFILVTDQGVLEQLEKTTPYMTWLKEAQGAIIITGRPSVSKYWIQDASIASGFIWLRATDLGIGVGFGAVYHHEDQNESTKRETWVREALQLPDDRRVLAILGLGYPKDKPKLKSLPQREEIIHYERFTGKTV